MDTAWFGKEQEDNKERGDVQGFHWRAQQALTVQAARDSQKPFPLKLSWERC